MNGALKGEVSDPEPTIGDWSNHMTTVFPDVRLKRFLEMRGADGGQWRRICALPAFWVGLLYSSSSLAAAEDYISEWTPEMVFDLREAVPKEGLNAKIAGQDLHFHARKILEISRLGLVERAVLNCEGFDESIYLNPLHETIASGLTPAEHLLQKYHGEWNESLDPLFREYAF